LRSARPDEDRIQKITELSGTINKILRDAAAGVTAVPQGADLCPFCEPTHRLRRHGTYRRTAVTADAVIRISIQRLLCAATGRTVSLLPDFLLPHKQHVIPVVATFFLAFALQRLSLAASIAYATIIYPSRQKGTYWIRCLLRNAPVVRIYMASVRPRQRIPRSEAVPLASPRGGFITRVRARLASLLDLLRDGFGSLQDAFRVHSRNMHTRLARALL
jgi:hypothetical protein